MSVTYVALSFAPEVSWAGLRELCGHDEQMVDSIDTSAAIQLLDRLLVNGQVGTLKPGSAGTLNAADRDRLLAALYVRTYGSRIAGSITCHTCSEPFDLEFDLTELLASLQPSPESSSRLEDGQPAFSLDDGRQFRLPTGEDELAIWHLSPDEAERELLRRCVIDGDPLAEPHTIQAAMNGIAPVVALDLKGECPECNTLASIRFDIQSYLLSTLRLEQPRLAQEVHRLARFYSWGLNEILGLTRTQRRTYARLIEAELSG